MASLMEELIQTLDAEESLYRELIPVQEEKTRAIIANNLKSLILPPFSGRIRKPSRLSRLKKS